MKKYENMSDNEKTKYSATGRCTAQEVSKFVDGKFIQITKWRLHYT